MSSILDLKSDCSDSEDDCDYVPPANAAGSDESEDEISDEESEIIEAPKAKKAKLDDKEEAKHTDKKSDNEIWSSFLKGVDSTPYRKSDEKRAGALTPDSPPKSQDIKNENPNIENKEIIHGNDSEKKDVDKSATEKVINEEENGIAEKDSGKLIGCDHHNTPLNNGQSNGNNSTQPESVKANNSAPRKGLSSILGTIANKGKKMTVLERSLSDWKTFKKEEGIEKDLETFNKGRQGFIERQRFLERSDLRAFETEKSARLFGKRK